MKKKEYKKLYKKLTDAVEDLSGIISALQEDKKLLVEFYRKTTSNSPTAVVEIEKMIRRDIYIGALSDIVMYGDPCVIGNGFVDQVNNTTDNDLKNN